MGEETCLNVKKPTSPPAGHYNGYWSCTTTGWQWYDSVDRKTETSTDEQVEVK